MRDIIRAQWFTDIAWLNARDNGAEFYEKKFLVYQECAFCGKEVGLGFILFTEDGRPKCNVCETPKKSFQNLWGIRLALGLDPDA